MVEPQLKCGAVQMFGNPPKRKSQTSMARTDAIGNATFWRGYSKVQNHLGLAG